MLRSFPLPVQTRLRQEGTQVGTGKGGDGSDSRDSSAAHALSVRDFDPIYERTGFRPPTCQTFPGSRHIGNQNTFDWAIIGVSELVGNAIKHTRSPKFRLFMWPPDRIGPMFGVWDDELTLPRIPTATPPNPHDLRESGYGLPSIRNFSHAMGAQFFAPEKNPGKLVWFQLDTRSAQWTDPDPRNGLAQNKGG